VTDPLDYTTQYAYDGARQVTLTTDALDQTTSQVYDGRRQPFGHLRRLDHLTRPFTTATTN